MSEGDPSCYRVWDECQRAKLHYESTQLSFLYGSQKLVEEFQCEFDATDEITLEATINKTGAKINILQKLTEMMQF